MSPSTGGSRYNMIWIKLKRGEEVKISAPREFHRRLRKAITKRRDRDLGFRFQLSEEHKVHRMSFKSEGAIFTVKLHILSNPKWI